jgi:hypothetical protein
MTRERLPSRRSAELVDFDHAGRRWTATVGRFPDGRVAEIFLDTPKASALGEIAADAAIVASTALRSPRSAMPSRAATLGRSGPRWT